MNKSSQTGNSLLLLVIIVGLAAVLGIIGFYVYSQIQSQSSQENVYTPPASKPDKMTYEQEVPEAKTASDLDKYTADLDKLDVNTLDSGE